MTDGRTEERLEKAIRLQNTSGAPQPRTNYCCIFCWFIGILRSCEMLCYSIGCFGFKYISLHINWHGYNSWGKMMIFAKVQVGGFSWESFPEKVQLGGFSCCHLSTLSWPRPVFATSSSKSWVESSSSLVWFLKIVFSNAVASLKARLCWCLLLLLGNSHLKKRASIPWGL